MILSMCIWAVWVARNSLLSPTHIWLYKDLYDGSPVKQLGIAHPGSMDPLHPLYLYSFLVIYIFVLYICTGLVVSAFLSLLIGQLWMRFAGWPGALVAVIAECLFLAVLLHAVELLVACFSCLHRRLTNLF
jgi:hypothetical protein